MASLPPFSLVILKNSAGEWPKTGHILVTDMDERGVRHGNPWFVRESWSPPDGDGMDTFKVHAGEQVTQDNSTMGVPFPGDDNRTPVYRIVPYEE